MRKPDAHLSLAAMLWQQNRVADAREIYRDGQALWPENAEIRKWLAEAEA